MVISEVELKLTKMEESSKGSDSRNDLIDVGNLVFSYEKSTDKDNWVRSKTDSSDEDSRRTSSSEEEFDKFGARLPLNKSRKPRALRESDSADRKWKSHLKNRYYRKDSSSSSSSSESDSSSEGDSSSEPVDSSEEFHMKKPTLKHAPEHPFYTWEMDRIHKEGKTEIVKLVEEIADDLRNPSELATKNTLGKFNVLTRIIRRMDATHIEEITRTLKGKHTDSKSKAWKTYRDALTEAGTGTSNW